MLTRRHFGSMAAGVGVALALPARGQTPPTPDQRLFGEGRYLPAYLNLKDRVAAGEPGTRGQLSQYAAFLGDEATALGDQPPITVPRPDLSDATAQDAIEAIVQASAAARIVILNEAHNISGHKAFAARVMRALRPMGFDWFAAEAFTPPQEEPSPSIRDYRQGAPFHSGFGWYTQDPVFAETVREAARLGYRFADYESRWNQRAPDDADPIAAITAREEAQADNLIEAILRPHPDARVFVLCGYDHAKEQPDGRAEWFASRLKRKTGLDPLTIEQAYNWPAPSPDNDEAHVAAVLERFAPTTPVVVRRGDGAMVSMGRYEGMMDMAVHHPRLTPVSGRPGWLAADPERRAVQVDVPTFEGVALLQAMRSGEGPAGVPADQFLLVPGQRRATVLLHPGPYLLRLERPLGIDPVYGEIRVEA